MHTTEFEDTDPELSRVAWDLAVSLAGECELAPSETIEVLE